MYMWYKKSSICYAYLSDVPLVYFSCSRWFTRGWTLQETIAPDYLEFYNRDWQVIGTKVSLQRMISVITDIPPKILCGESPDTCPVAQKMSWAAKRTTTKPEDLAYCLMGIFHVNMPMLYGEGGSEAFHRLQRGIMEITEDHTLFTWQQCDQALANYGFLANSPEAFLPSSSYRPSDLVAIHPADSSGDSEPPSLTGRGLRIQLPLRVSTESPRSRETESIVHAILNVEQASTGKRAFVYLAKGRQKLNYRRMDRKFGFMPAKDVGSIQLSTVYINHVHPDLWDYNPMIAMESHLVISSQSDCLGLQHSLSYEYGKPKKDDLGIAVPEPEPIGQGTWSLAMSVSPYIDTLKVLLFGLLDQSGQNLGHFSVTVGFNRSYLPWCTVCLEPEIEKQSDGKWSLIASDRPRIWGRYRKGTTIMTVDRVETNLASGHKLLVVVRRRAQILGDRPIFQNQTMTESGRHVCVYTLHVWLDDALPELAPESPHATAGASLSPRSTPPASMRALTMDLAGMGLLFPQSEDDSDFGQPHHVGTSDSIVTSLSDEMSDSDIQAEQTNTCAFSGCRICSPQNL
jgi:hypothetical protein